MINCLVVGIGGFIGAVCRYLIGFIPVKSESLFPIKTLLINIVGAFVIGLITTLAIKHNYVNSRIVLMLKVGVCGGFTTFSTFAFETSDLIQNGHVIIALAYILLSVVLGVLAVYSFQIFIN